MQDTAVTAATTATALHTVDRNAPLWVLVRNNSSTIAVQIGSSAVDTDEGNGVKLLAGEREYFLVPPGQLLYGAAASSTVAVGVFAVHDARHMAG